MKRARWCRWLLCGWVAAGCCLFATTGRGAEEARKFLERLRDPEGQFRYYDTALEYLELMRTSPMVDQEFKDSIDYEAGVTLFQAAQAGRVVADREQLLADARLKFEKFLKDHPTHKLAPGASSKLADLLAERGNILAEQAMKPGKAPDEKKQLLDEARKLYEDAGKQFKTLETTLVEALKKFPELIDENTEPDKYAERDQARQDLLQTRLALATMLYRVSKTYPDGSAENVKNLTDAAAAYAEMFRKYPTYGGGLYGHLWEGRCYKELALVVKDKADEYYTKAYDAFDDLFLETEEDPRTFRILRNKTTLLYLETCMQQKGKGYEKAVEIYQQWDKLARPDDAMSEAGLGIQYTIGDVKYYSAMKQGTKESDKKRYLAEAKRLFKSVAATRSEWGKRAKEALARSGFPEEGDLPPPTTFEEARDRGLEALRQVTNPDLPADAIEKARIDAIEFYRLALKLRPPTAPIDEVNVLRYYLAYLHYMSGDLYEAMVAGEFVARRYPAGTGGQQGAEIAMAAYAGLLSTTTGELRQAQADLKDAQSDAAAPLTQAELEQLTTRVDQLTDETQFLSDATGNLSQFVIERWQGKPVADKAWMMLINKAINEDDLAKAQEDLKNLSEENPNRGAVELNIGQKLWGNYLSLSREHQKANKAYLAKMKEADADPTELGAMKTALDQTRAELDSLVTDAQKIMSDGIARMRKPVDAGEELTYPLLAAVLSLAQINVDVGQPQKAVDLLDDKKIGPMVLVAMDPPHPATEREKFHVETYKAALRAYVGIQDLERAKQTMAALEDQVNSSDDPAAGETLTRIYIALGLQLQSLLERLRAEDKVEEAAAVSRGFKLFLDGIAQREQGNSFGSLNWVAQTFISLGDDMTTEGEAPPDEAKEYYQAAADIYGGLLQRLDDPSLNAPANADVPIRVRQSRCLRKLGNYQEAIAIIAAILKTREAMLDLQVEAAMAYQEWGGLNDETAAMYGEAIKGSSTHEQIWGWGLLARRVTGHDKFADVLHKARYNLAVCRYELGKTKKTEADREKYYTQADKDIMVVNRIYPRMGGPEWYPKYNALLLEIRQSLGQDSPEGLPPAPPPDPPEETDPDDPPTDITSAE